MAPSQLEFLVSLTVPLLTLIVPQTRELVSDDFGREGDTRVYCRLRIACRSGVST